MRTDSRTLITTSLAPSIWGTTYLVTSQWLPPDLEADAQRPRPRRA